ncbi:MAG: HTH domain-containing protein, partial [Steroidobacterales bacterium]
MTIRAKKSSAPLASHLYLALADGQFHSGADLARNFGVSRSAIWKAVAALKQLGMLVRAVPNRGYCLPRASVPLDAQA